MHHFSVHKTQTRNHIEPNSLPLRPIGVSFLIFKQEKTEKHQPRKKINGINCRIPQYIC
jgi:hypothetical protein